MNRLHGKVALITGATGGLGQSFAQSFVREGANVILTGRDRELGERIASELGGSALFMTQDVSDPDDWTKVVEAGVERFGPITVLVNNAGVSGRPVSTLELSPEDYHQTINVDQTGTFYGMRAVIPGMIAAGGGSIINISSVAGIAATSGYPNGRLHGREVRGPGTHQGGGDRVRPAEHPRQLRPPRRRADRDDQYAARTRRRRVPQKPGREPSPCADSPGQRRSPQPCSSSHPTNRPTQPAPSTSSTEASPHNSAATSLDPPLSPQCDHPAPPDNRPARRGLRAE